MFDVWRGNGRDINGFAPVESRILSRLRERKHEKNSAKQDIFGILYYQNQDREDTLTMEWWMKNKIKRYRDPLSQYVRLKETG